MVLETALFIFALAGFSLAGYLDLKTTEFYDWIPYSIIIVSLAISSMLFFSMGNFSYLANSLISGCIFGAVGLIMYMTKQWGDGDAWLITALGFALPSADFLMLKHAGFLQQAIPFQLTLLFNLFFISFVYIIIYSLAIGLKNKQVNEKFKEFAAENKLYIIGAFVFVAISSLFSGFNSLSILGMKPITYLLFAAPPAFFGLGLFIFYSKIIEDVAFKKKISSRKLKAGDVLVKSRWKGLTENEVKRLKKKGGSVVVKEGVRFSAVFAVTFLLTHLFGSLVALFMA